MEVKKGRMNMRIPIVSIGERGERGEIFLPISEREFISAFPIKEGCESTNDIEKAVKKFENEFGYPVSITTDEEWDKLIKYCNNNSCLLEFIKVNKLDKNAVVNVTDTNSEGIIFRAGEGHSIADKYFINVKSPKAVFVTVRMKIPKNP